MAGPAENIGEEGRARIEVFVPLRRWSLGMWVFSLAWFAIGGVVLAVMVGSAWVFAGAGRWEVVLPVAAGPLWWWLFGVDAVWLVRSIFRGGHPLVVLVCGRRLALGMNDQGTLVRAFEDPTLRDTDRDLILENSSYFMEAWLPKDQLTEDEVELVRRCARPAAPAGQG